MPTKCSDANLGMQIDIYGNPGTHVNALRVQAEAFDVLYSCLRRDMYTYLYFMGCHQHIADKILVHVWDLVIENRRRLADQGSKAPNSIRTYVFNQARMKLLEPKYTKELQDSVWDPDDKRPKVTRIMQLPKRDRDLFLLRRMHLSRAAIAEICDLTLEEVTDILKSTMKKLQD